MIKRFFLPYRYDISVINPQSGEEVAFIKSDFKQWFADPFLFSNGQSSKPDVFVELMKTTVKRGEIAVFNPEYRSYQIALSEPFHLSFPNVFKIGSSIFMIPETSAIKEVRIYQCEKYPTEWKFLKTLVKDVDSVDNVVFSANGQWFLGCYVRNSKPYSLKFYRFDVNSLELSDKPVSEHQDPSKRLRPAGNPFVFEGKLLLPTQLGARSYGERVLFQELTHLGDGFELREVTPSIPLPQRLQNYGHFHTYNIYNQEYACVDMAKKHFSLIQGVYGIPASIRIRKK